MFKTIQTLALSALIGMGAIAATPASAEAAGGSVYLSFGSGHGPGANFHFDNRGRHHYRGNHRSFGPRHMRECSPHQAVSKASRMGLRHARIINSNRHVIRVAGRGHGYRSATITFGKGPSCPVLR